MREFVEVSAEMTLLLGAGPLGGVPMPPNYIALAFDADSDAPSIAFDLSPSLASLSNETRLTLVIERAAFLRVGGVMPTGVEFHLPSALRAIVRSIREAELSGETLTIYRLGKSIELLCETIQLLAGDELLPLTGEGALSLEDTRRVVAARRIIDERWNEKLTLDTIARACGLNRAKLTRGFRDMFKCSIAEAIAEQRLSRAKRMLLTTNLPVSSIGYENGYLNNASFARAFGRRFGVSPSDLRACAAAA
ncbi:helix-turn-helix transcriptional regulator [Vitreimonas flagellata]|uniref:helix-turn-helix transcriptional regulator n=1 Tax=Vitreimonas flagellata TaxID=2560861 RepID=UPI00107541BB|nr:AraC family transcriptional regulator [Vitreimonas flagellata]